MPTAKPKVVKGKEAKKLIQDYMVAQNRPFGAGIVQSNLKNAVGKTETVRILDELVEEGVLESKDYKKFRYYWANQRNIPEARDPSDIKKEIENAEFELKTLSNEAVTIQKKRDALQSALSDEDLEAKIAALEKENAELSTRLQEAKGSSESVSKDSVEKIDKALKSQVTAWRKRKRCAMDMVNEIAEGSGESVKTLFKTIELENDESNKVTLTEAIKATEPPPPPKKRFKS
uniref:Homologous-pairing protein 2 winged helix domain-containing protein n=1 Tax=Paramoeba aestuarina TaxID=180227 RepID=A0A7S4NKJ7_9EUKA